MRRIAAALVFVSLAACGGESVKVVRVPERTTTPTTPQENAVGENYGDGDMVWCSLFADFLDAPPGSDAEIDAFDAQFEFEETDPSFGPVLGALIDEYKRLPTGEAGEAVFDSLVTFCFEEDS